MSLGLCAMVRRDGRFESWFDSARVFGTELVSGGHEGTLDWLRGMEPTEWALQDFVGEDMPGGLFVDEDAHRLYWFDEETLYLPRLLNILIERSWPGWTAVWAPEGMDGILHAAGVTGMEGSHTFYGYPPCDLATKFDPWGKNYGDMCSCRTSDGRILAWQGDHYLSDVALAGPDGVARLAGKVRELTDSGAHAPIAENPSARAAEPWWKRIFHAQKSVQPHSNDSAATSGGARDGASDSAVDAAAPGLLYDRQKHKEAASGGIHIDFPARQVRWWCNGLAAGWDECYWDFDGAWRGWSVETWGDDAGPQERIVGRPLMNYEREYANTLSTFSYSGSPVQLVADTLGPLARQVPPPARIITRHGAIIPAL